MRNSNTKILIIAAIAIAINVVVGEFVSFLHLPLLYLDALGTIFISAKIGLKWGVLVGVCTNLVMGLISGWSAVPFLVVSICIALVVFCMSRSGFGIPRAVVTGLVLGVVCSVVGTIVTVALFGGLTGSGTDLLILYFKATGEEIAKATFYSTLLSNLVDKIISCVVVSIVINKLPKNVMDGF